MFSLFVQKFANNEVGQLLWNVFTHGTADALRIAALSVSATYSIVFLGGYLRVCVFVCVCVRAVHSVPEEMITNMTNVIFFW